MAFDYTGSFSGSFFGDITASNGVLSSSAQVIANLPAGSISSSAQVSYNSLTNKPTTISSFQKNSITANNNFRQTTYPAMSSSVATRLTTLEGATDNTGSEQTLSFNDGTNALSISSGNSVDLSSLAAGGGGGGGTNITASNEGSALSKAVRSFDFVGNAVTATNSGNAVTVTINTGSGGGGGVPSGTISSSAQLPSGILSSSAQVTSAGFVSQSGGVVDLPNVKIQYANVYTNIGDLPSAANYHGMFAHVHATGKGYFAHGGAWIELQNAGGVISSSAQLSSDISGSLSATAIAGLGAGILSGSITSVDSASVAELSNYTAQWTLGANGASHYTFTGPGLTGAEDDPTIYLTRGQKYKFIHNAGGAHPFRIQSTPNGSAGTAYNDGITNNNLSSGTLTWDVQFDAPRVLYYQCTNHSNMGGVIYIDNANTGSGGGGGSTDISALNTFTGSAQTSITALNTFTGSAISNSQTSSMTVATASYSLFAVSASHEIVTEVSSSHAVNADTASFVIGHVQTSQTSSMSVATASFATGFTIFNGNRVISNTSLPAGVYNTNAGTSGSLSQFVEKIFFPNTVPSITTNGFTIGEFVASGSSVGTVTATDAEGQSITFRTASSYTADKFRISSAGAVTLNTKSTSSLNTDNTPGSGSHPFLVEAVDTFAGVGSKTIYIRVTPNTAPKWRQTSVGGSVVTTFTQSLNENSTAANNKVRVYFTDDESDTITIGSGSVPSGFTFTKAGTYVQLNQTTASLDFETTPKYELVLTASDEHYVSGDDTSAIAYLPFQIAVVDNVSPTVNDQTLGSINENSSDGDEVGTITATDPTGDTIVFSNFTLKEANLDGGSNITSSLGGASLYNPSSNPFQCSSAGVVTRKNGVYLNSDIANRYFYQVTVKDAFNTTSDTGLIRINIADDAASAISDNWDNLYIIESATSGNEIKISSNGRTGTSGQWSSGASQRWEVKSTGNLIGLSATTGSSTTLRLASNLSGSAYSSGSTIAVELTASENGFETTKQFVNQNIAVVINNAPVPSFSNTSANLNTNGARSGSTITTISFTDTESDSLNHNSFTFTDPSGQLNAYKSGDTYLVQPKNNLSGSNYQMTASIKDTHGFRTGTTKHSVTIAQAGIGTLGGDTESHIIESALSGSVIRDASGFGGGNPSQLTVSYSPQYNSAAVQSFTSSNSDIAINNSGNLTMAVHVSGSPSSSGDTFTSTITYQDQFGNVGSGSLTVNVFANQAPTATFSEVGANMTASVAASTNLTTIAITDTESDTPFSASLSGAHAGNLKLVPQNANSSSYQLQSAGTISTGVTYNYTASIHDNFNKSRNYNRSITILDPVAKVYVYGWDGGSAASEAAAIASLGDSGADGVAITSGSVIAHLQSGSLGQTFNPTYVGGQMLLFGSSSKATLSDSNSTGLSSFGYINFSSGGSKRLVVLFPSASNQGGKPVSMYDGVPPDSTGTANEYYVYAKDASIPGTIGTGVYYFNTENAVEGYSKWGMIFAEGENTNNSRYYLMPDSASAP